MAACLWAGLAVLAGAFVSPVQLPAPSRSAVTPGAVPVPLPGIQAPFPAAPRVAPRAEWPVLLEPGKGSPPSGATPKVPQYGGESRTGVSVSRVGTAEPARNSMTYGAAALGPFAQLVFRTRRLLGSGEISMKAPGRGLKLGIRAFLLLGGASLAWATQRAMRFGVVSVFGPFAVAGLWGVASGALHSLTGPDHIAGLTALAINQPVGPAVSLATIWASGHVTGQCSIGAGLVLLRSLGAPVIQQLLFERWATFGIAASLFIIGGIGLFEARAGPGEAELNTSGTISRKLVRGTYTTGFVHGLAPDGLVMLLPVLAMSVPRAVVHLLGIFLGTCGAMSACTGLFCASARRLEQYSVERGEKMGRMQMRISIISSLVAIALGGVMICEMFL